MKITYTRPDGGTSVFWPAPGARLARSVILKDGSKRVSDRPVPVDQFLRGWPVNGATAEWAETDEEFLRRLMPRAIPQDATNVQFVSDDLVLPDRAARIAEKQNRRARVRSAP